MFLERGELLLERGDVFFVADDADDVVARRDTQFRTQGPQHAQVGVARAVENLRVGLFENQVFIDHASYFSAKLSNPGERKPYNFRTFAWRYDKVI